MSVGVALLVDDRVITGVSSLFVDPEADVTRPPGFCVGEPKSK